MRKTFGCGVARSGTALFLSATAAILISGCSSLTDEKPSVARDWAAVRAAPGHTHVFIFAVGDSIEARPMSGNEHRIDINSKYVGIFSNDEFLELDLPAGQYAFEDYDYGWFGKLELHGTWNFSFSGSGEPSFLAVSNHSDALSLTPVSADLGKRSIDGRSKASLAVDSSTIFAQPPHAPAGM